MPSAASSISWTLPTKPKFPPSIDHAMRVKAVSLLSSMIGESNWQFARELEQSAYFHSAQRIQHYIDHVKRLTHAVISKPALLDLPAKVVAELEDDAIDDEQMERWRIDYVEMKRKRKEEEEASHAPVHDDEDDAPDGAFIKCKQCGSTQVTWTQAQTRSADEAMTVFYQCSKCQKRWKG